MKVRVSFLHLSSNPEVVAFAESKIEKVLQFIHNPMDCTMEISQDNLQRYHVEVHLTANKVRLVAEANAENVYKCVDTAFEKLKRQSSRWKDKHTSHKKVEQEAIFMQDWAPRRVA